MLESGRVEAILIKSKLTVNLVHLSEAEKGEDQTAPILRAMDDIKCLKPDIILLCTNKENIKLMLQQVGNEFFFAFIEYCYKIDNAPRPKPSWFHTLS